LNASNGTVPPVRPFLSEAWFETAQELASALPAQPGRSCVLGFRTGRPWVLAVADGRVSRIEEGEAAGAVELRSDVDHALALWRGELDGTAALAGFTCVEPDGRCGPPPPLDLRDTPALLDLPRLPGASVSVQYEYRDGPFGTVDFVLRFEDGGVADAALGRAESPDVRVAVPYGAIADVRCGERTLYEALEDGEVKGDLGPLMTAAGLFDSPAFRAAELETCGSAAAVLATFGLVSATPAWQEMLATLAAVTAPPG
jgi:hypothetical protein